MKKDKIKYVEPAEYFPKSIREKCCLGEFAVSDKQESNENLNRK